MTTINSTFTVDRTNRTVIVPAGRYYLCDPCYEVRDEHWMPWLEAANYTKERDLYALTPDGYPVLGFATAYGDGCWTGSDGRRYGADSGLIGLVPVAYNPGGQWAFIKIVTFTEDTVCRATKAGTLHFGDITIETWR